MWALDNSILADPARLSATQHALRMLRPRRTVLNSLAWLTARAVKVPAVHMTVVQQDQEHLVGVHDAIVSTSQHANLLLPASMCAYVVCADSPVSASGTDNTNVQSLAQHPPLAHDGVRAFLAVPVRDRAGLVVGAVAALATEARAWSDDDVSALQAVADVLLPPADLTSARETVPAQLDSRGLLNTMHEAFLAVDAHGVICDCNAAAVALLGFSADDLLGRHLQETLMPEYRGDDIGHALARLFTAGPTRPVQREVSVRHRDGSRLMTRATLSVVPSSGGPVACVFLTDLSSQAAAQKAAAHSDGFLRALLDSLSVGVMACDDRGQVIVMNRALREAMDMPETTEVPVDLPARLHNALYDARLRPIAWDQTPLMRARQGEHVDDVDVLTAAPGRRTRTFASTAQPILGADGTRLGAVAVAHEVTALRRVERFGACHTMVQAAFTNAGSAEDAAAAVAKAVATTLGWPYVELFLTEGPSERLAPVGHWSTPGAEPTGFFGHQPVRGEGVTGRVWQSGQAMWVSDIADSFSSGTPWERERTRICVDNGIHTVLAVPVRDGGTLLGVMSCFADAQEVHEDLLTVLLEGVAAQVGVYVALRRAEELTRQLARAQDDFLDLVGHELRTPLTSIAANAALLGEETYSLDGDCRQMVDAVVRNTETLQHLVDTLLDLAALESGHAPLSIEATDFAEIVTGAVTAIRLVAAEAGVRLQTSGLTHAPIEADPRRLRQVVDDLLSNAVKYSPPGAEVCVSLTCDGRNTELEIADTGIGTPAQEQDWVFNRFFRASNVRHQGTAGSGLGLSLARAIVHLHGGAISLRHSEPTGTTVSVRLPQPPTSATSPHPIE